MMASTQSFILMAVSVLCLAQGSWAISCLICNSTNPDCASNIAAIKSEDCSAWCKGQGGFIPAIGAAQSASAQSQFPATPCPTAFTGCRKIKQQTTHAGKTEDRVIRSCAYANGTKEYEYRSSEASKSEIFTCFTDGCNSADSLAISFIALVFALFFAFISY